MPTKLPIPTTLAEADAYKAAGKTFDQSTGEWFEPDKTGEVPKVRRYTGDDKMAEFFEGLSTEMPTPQTEADIRGAYLKSIQPQIALIENDAAKALVGAEERGVAQAGRARSIAGRAGLIGSPRGEAIVTEVETATKEEKALIGQEKTLKIEALLNQTDTRASEAIVAKRQEVVGNVNAYLAWQAGVKTEAKADVQSLAQEGMTLEQLKLSTDENGKNYYDTLLKQTGWSNFVFDSVYNLSLSKENQEEKLFSEVTSDGKLTVMWKNPKTGKVRTEKYAWDNPTVEAGWTVDVAPNGTMYKWNKEGKVEIIGEGYAKPEGEYKFTSTDIGRLLNTGLSQSDITNIQNDIKQYGIEKVKGGLSGEQASVLDQVLKGVTPTQAKDETQRTWADQEIKDKIKENYKKGYTKEDLAISLKAKEGITQADKDKAQELLDEIISDELNEWLKKTQSDPDKYKVKDDGIYEVRKGWFDKRVYSF